MDVPVWRVAVEPQRWRALPQGVVDAALAGVLFAATLPPLLGLYQTWTAPIPAWAYLLVALETLPLVLRRRYPLTVCAVVLAASGVYGVAVLPDPPVPFGALVAFYSVAAYGARRVALLAAALTAVTVPVVEVVAEARIANYLWMYLLLAVAWLLGEAARSRRAYAAVMAERAERLARERAAEVGRAAAEERARIAREMHDVLGHAVSLMVVQAEAGAVAVESDPAAAGRAFDAIGSTGREALGELRRLVGVLRTAAEPTGRRPQPGLEDVAGLVDRARQAGLTVALTVTGAVRSLPAGLSLTVYRIVQQAMTNSAQHAPGAAIDVRLSFAPDRLDVVVSDTGSPGGPAATGEGGVGLLGLRERAAVYGGHCHAGPDGRGWAVTARFPLAAPARPAGVAPAPDVVSEGVPR